MTVEICVYFSLNLIILEITKCNCKKLAVKQITKSEIVAIDSVMSSGPAEVSCQKIQSHKAV